MARAMPRCQHPCPRMIHHPNERCRCSEKYDVMRPPLGLGGASSSVHTARIQNLRWRLPFTTVPARGVASLPPSLRVLSEDLPSRATSRAIRPLSPGLRRSSLKAKRSKPRPTLRQPSVAFSDIMEVEVPVLVASPEKMVPLPVRGHCAERVPSPRLTPAKAEERARANLARLVANNKSVWSQFQEAFDFVTECMAFLKDGPALFRKHQRLQHAEDLSVALGAPPPANSIATS